MKSKSGLTLDRLKTTILEKVDRALPLCTGVPVIYVAPNIMRLLNGTKTLKSIPYDVVEREELGINTVYVGDRA